MANEQALADRLRQQEMLATVGMMSGDPVLGGMGKQNLARVAAERERRAKAQRAAQQVMPLGEGYYAQGGQISQVPGYEEARVRRDQRALEKALAVAQMQRQAGFEDWYAKKQTELDMPTRTQATAAREFEGQLPAFQEFAGSLQQVGEIPKFSEGAARLMRSSPIGGEEAAAAIERHGMTPEQVDWLAKGRRMEQELTRIESGLAVTGFELENLKKWSPWASGLTNRERIKRLENVHNAFGRRAASVMNRPWKDVKYQGTSSEPPARPEGITDEEWNQYLKLEGFQ